MKVSKINNKLYCNNSNITFEKLIIRKSAIKREYFLIINRHAEMIADALKKADTRLKKLAEDTDIIFTYSEEDKKTPAELRITCKKIYKSFVDKVKNFNFLDEGVLAKLNPDKHTSKHFDEAIVEQVEKTRKIALGI